MVVLQGPLRGIERACACAGLGILAHGLLGAVVTWCGSTKQWAAIGGLVAINTAAYVINRRHSAKTEAVVSESRLALLFVCAVWLGLTLVATALSRAPCRPAVYYDGPYVYKMDVQSTRIQSLFGDLPCDNVLPHAVAEFLLRDIPFAVERPIMPGQEVSNRPILMSLVAVPFRAAFDPPPLHHGRLGRFQYVGSSWPDIGPLMGDWEFSQFLSVGLLLNATWILGALWVLSLAKTPPVITLLSVLAFATSYYVLSQTVFTWPKAAASFWIIAAVIARLSDSRFVGWGELSQRKTAVAGACLGVAFWMHPLAVLFFIGSLLVQLWTVLAVRSRRSVENVLVFAVSFIGVIAPWVVWTRLILGIPADLLSQNMRVTSSASTALWVRVANLYHLFVPACFDSPPVTYAAFMNSWWLTISASCGIAAAGLFYVAATHRTIAPWKSWKALFTECFVLPGLLICSVFGFNNAACTLHGFQMHMAALAPTILLVSPGLAHRSLVRLTATCLFLQMTANVVYSVPQIVRRCKSTVSDQASQATDLLRNTSVRIENAPLPVNRSERITLAGVERTCLWLNAPTRATVGPVRLTNNAIVSAWIGIHEHVVPIIPAEGINFRLQAIHEDRVIAATVVNLSPATRAGDRGWRRLELFVPEGRGLAVNLLLDVGDSPVEGHIDWCLWSEVNLN